MCRWKLSLSLSLLGAIAACQSSGEDAELAAAPLGESTAAVLDTSASDPIDVEPDTGKILVPGSGDVLGRRDPQGTKLRGSIDEEWQPSPAYRSNSAAFPGSTDAEAVTAVASERGLVVTRGGRQLEPSELVGLTFTLDSTARVQHVRIKALGPSDAKGRARYVMEFSPTSSLPPWRTDPWEPLCYTASYAYAVPGYFDDAGRFFESSSLVTFACGDGTVAKAMRWNYGTLPYFEAATRAARADYCSSSDSYTFEGTQIIIYDREGTVDGSIVEDSATAPPIARGPSALPFTFEAAWAPRTSGQPHAVCLSRELWATLPPGGYCGNLGEDPRLSGNGDAALACEDLGALGAGSFRDFLDRLAQAGAVLYTHSQQRELALWQWSDASTQETLATTSGVFDEHPGLATQPRVGNGVCPKRYVATRTGYLATIFREQEQATIPLRLFYNAATGDHWTTTQCDSPEACLPEPWQLVETVGYVYRSTRGPIASPRPRLGSHFRLVEMGTAVKTVDGTVVDSILARYSNASNQVLPPPAGYAWLRIEGFGMEPKGPTPRP